ncbi:MAG: hypothetical protein ACYDCI_00010 [Candidatus Limnocylindrales bacterium]
MTTAMKTTKKIDWSKPVLRKQSTDLTEPVAQRNATESEVRKSREAAHGQDGYFDVPGIGTCFVEE